MEAIDVSATRVDETRHFAVLDEAKLKSIVAEAVAKAAGLNLSDAGVMIDQICFVTSARSTGQELTARCTLVVDHSRAVHAKRPATGHSID